MVAFLRTSGRWLIWLAAAAWFTLPAPAHAQDRAQPVAAELSAKMEAGFARLIFTFPEELKADVQLRGNVLVVKFARPVKVAVDQVRPALRDLVSAARADPDNTAVRIAFSHKVSVNVMEAGEKLFVDVMPESWTGLPPGLPQDVVDELTRRARDAEKKAKNQPVVQRVWKPVKLRFAEAPAFARFAFTLGEPVQISTEQDGQEFRITFAAPLKIDLGEAQAALPPSVVSLDADYADGVAVARMVLAPYATLRHFREENAFVVDVTPPPPMKPEQIQGELPAPEPNAQAEVAPQPAPQVTPQAMPQQNALQIPKQDMAAQLPPVAPLEGPNPQAAPMKPEAPGTVVATVTASPAGLRLSFPFHEPVAAAVFRRGDRVFIVFDTKERINVGELTEDKSRMFADAALADIPDAKVIRLKLKGGWLTSVESDGKNWTIHFADAVIAPSKPLAIRRLSEENGATVAVPLEGADRGKVHRIDDSEIGDDIRVVTAMLPTRGVLRGQDFVEFKLLPSAHGIALLPIADDLEVVLKSDFAMIGRPQGLALSAPQRAPVMRPERATASALDATVWEAEKNRRFREREAEILAAAAAAPVNQRRDARLQLATFYLANGLATEAKGALESVVREDSKAPLNARFHLLRGMSELVLGRPAKALEDLSNAELNASQDAALLRAVAFAELSRWGDVREHFRAGFAGLKLLPAELQRSVLFAALRAAVEVRDFSEAGRLLADLEAAEVPANQTALFAVLAGRIAEGLGRYDRAESFYAAAAKDMDGAAAAEARFKLVEVKFSRGEYNRAKAIDRLEALAFNWRGDNIELETSRLLARLYVGEARYRDAFRLLDAALLSQANLPGTRTFQNEMAAVFEDLFLSDKADALPAIDALALYYDFAKLTPIGRRGDELIRRLSERLVSVDLLDQASELLQHQVEFRLTGAAKAQVAARLAVVHLMNRKPQRAVAVLAATRLAELPQDLREQRLLLESRGLMDANRFDQALNVISNLQGPEADRQRADVQWAAKRWRPAGEAIEKMLGERWNDEAALNEIERHDVLRAGLAYALAGETLALTRLKEKYGPRFEAGPEKAAFDQIGANPNPRVVSAAAKALSNVDSLAVFLKLYQAKYPSAQRADQLSAR
jgi:hypothetical protein